MSENVQTTDAVTSPATPEGKTFTQEQLNDIVEGRLARQRQEFEKRYVDYDSYKSSHEQLNSFKSELDSLKNSSAKANESLQLVHDNLMAQISDEKKSLIPESLNVPDKIIYIQKNSKHLLSQTIQGQTPPPEDKTIGDPGLIMGKYKDSMDFAQADPKGFLEWLKKERNQNI